MKVLEMIKILFKLFKNKEKQIFNKQNILTDSNQKASIFKIYLKKGQLSRSNYKFIYKCQSKLAKVLLKTQK